LSFVDFFLSDCGKIVCYSAVADNIPCALFVEARGGGGSDKSFWDKLPGWGYKKSLSAFYPLVSHTLLQCSGSEINNFGFDSGSSN